MDAHIKAKEAMLVVDGDGAVRTITPPMTEDEYTQRWGELNDRDAPLV